MADRVLYLHGLLSSPRSRKALFFADRLRRRGVGVRVPDLNEGDFSRLTTSRAVRLARAEAAHLRPPYFIIGSSFGGRVAAHAAATLGAELAGLVLLAPAFDLQDVWRRTQPPQALARWRERGTLRLEHPAFAEPVDLRYDFYEDAVATDGLPPLRPDLPVLLLHGDQDDVVAPELSERFARAHPASRHRVLPGVDHAMQGAEERLWAEVTAFLHDVAPELLTAD